MYLSLSKVTGYTILFSKSQFFQRSEDAYLLSFIVGVAGCTGPILITEGLASLAGVCVCFYLVAIQGTSQWNVSREVC